MLLEIFNEKQVYYMEYESFCYQNNVRQILENMKVKNSFAYINASLSIIVHKKNTCDITIYSEPCLNGVIPMAKELVFRTDDERNIYDVWQENIKMIESGYPLIITTDSYYVPHLPFYYSSHGRHCFIVAGLNDNNGNPFVIDWCDPWYFKGEMNLNDFIKARSSKNEFDGGIFSGMAINNNWSYIKKDGWDKYDSRDAVKELLDISCNQYNCEGVNGYTFGIKALKEILKWLDCLKSIEVEERKSRIRNLYFQLYWPIKRKLFFSFYIRKAIEEGLLPREYFEVINKGKVIYDNWDFLSKYILKQSFVGKEQSIEKIKDKLCEIIFLEEEFITIIDSYKSIYI